MQIIYDAVKVEMEELLIKKIGIEFTQYIHELNEQLFPYFMEFCKIKQKYNPNFDYMDFYFNLFKFCMGMFIAGKISFVNIKKEE